MTQLTSGIIIKRSHSGDFDRHYLIYTEEFGKITAIAKGAKKVSSKLSSHLDCFVVSDLMLAKGVGPYRLAGAQLSKNFCLLKNNSLKIAYAYLFLEALDYLTVDNHQDVYLFNLVSQFFSSLNESDGIFPATKVINKFLFELLAHSGYRPQIKAINQRQLTRELAKAITEATDKNLKSLALINF